MLKISKILFITYFILRVVFAYSYEIFYKSEYYQVAKDGLNTFMFFVGSVCMLFVIAGNYKLIYKALAFILLIIEANYLTHELCCIFATDFQNTLLGVNGIIGISLILLNRKKIEIKLKNVFRFSNI